MRLLAWLEKEHMGLSIKRKIKKLEKLVFQNKTDINKCYYSLVAIKKFKESDEDEIVKKTTFREVKMLRMLK